MLPLQLPTIQNWSCHNCGGCCTQHLIEVTEEERQRILKQNWTSAEGIPAEQTVLEWHAGPPWKKRYRLAHRATGACVFLDDKGLCRIHAKFGEAAKPLACRIYPYALHPQGMSVTVSLRYSCPSVVKNLGRPLPQQMSDLRIIEKLVVPDGVERIAPPALSPGSRVDWPVFRRFVANLDQILAETQTPFVLRLIQALAWTNLIQQSRFDGLSDQKLHEFLQLVTAAVHVEFAQLPEPMAEPTRVGQLYFRLAAAQYARKDTVADLKGGWSARWKLLRAVLRYSKGQGDVPPLRDGFQPVPFADLEEPCGPLSAEADELLTRYLRVKVQGLHFCGRAFYDVPFAEGFASLALIIPVTMWLARWRARSQQRTTWTLDDLQFALTVADHHHGFSPAFGQSVSRRRMRYLTTSGDLTRLCVWYAK